MMGVVHQDGAGAVRRSGRLPLVPSGQLSSNQLRENSAIFISFIDIGTK